MVRLAAGQIRAGGEAVPPSQIAHETILPANRADFHLRGCNCQSGGGGVILDLEVHFTLAGEPGTMANCKRDAPKDWAARCRDGRPIDLIDVRTPVEYQEVHAEPARNVPLDQLDLLAVVQGPGGAGRRADLRDLPLGWPGGH